MESHSPVSETERKMRAVILQAATPSTEKGRGVGEGKVGGEGGRSGRAPSRCPPKSDADVTQQGACPAAEQAA